MKIDQDIETIEQTLRQEAEAKIAVVRDLKRIHGELLEKRQEFNDADARRRDELNSALAAARKAGFADADLKDWNVEPLRGAGPVRRKRGTPPRSSSNGVATSTSGGEDTAQSPQ